ncbi:MAG: hypothetical protein AAGC95_18735 [Pseudomonadota bacterium]
MTIGLRGLATFFSLLIGGAAAGAGAASVFAPGAPAAALVGAACFPLCLIIGFAVWQRTMFEAGAQRFVRVCGDILHGRHVGEAIRDHYADFVSRPITGTWAITPLSILAGGATGALVGMAPHGLGVATSVVLYAVIGFIYGQIVRLAARAGAIPSPSWM